MKRGWRNQNKGIGIKKIIRWIKIENWGRILKRGWMNRSNNEGSWENKTWKKWSGTFKIIRVWMKLNRMRVKDKRRIRIKI